MITIYFTEFNEELRAPMNIGELDVETFNKEKAIEEADKYVSMLEKLKGKKISYMLDRDKRILVNNFM